MTQEIYLDNNATTQPLPEVREAMIAVLGADFGNPSSAHSAGDRTRERISIVRETVARLIGANSDQIFFTSGGTEANNTVLNTIIQRSWKKSGTVRIVTTPVEHSSIIKMCDFLEGRDVEVVYAPINASGLLDWPAFESLVTPQTDLVSVQWVNNETGVIQPVDKIGYLCQSRGVLFHTDAAQAVGKLPVKVLDLPVDFLTLTGHKFHGPQGIGAIYAKARRSLFPLLWGGSQEEGLRPGTENVSGIVGIGRAAQLRFEGFDHVCQHLKILRDIFEDRILSQISDVRVNGDLGNRICNTTNLMFHEVDGQALTARLDQEGIRCSQSSACTNQRPEPSYVLRAMGLSEINAYASVRFSFSELNTFEEIDFVVKQIKNLCEQLRRFKRKHRLVEVP